MNKTDLLKAIPLFSGLNQDLIETVAEKVLDRRYKKGMLIFLEGEPGDSIFVIYSGKVKLTMSSEEGQEKIILILQAGDLLGEVVLFDSGPYPVTAEVIEDSHIGSLGVKEVDELLLVNPDLSINLLKIMSKRLRQLQRQIKNLALKDAYGRLASRLFKLGREYGVDIEEGKQIKVALTHQELANFIGTSRETVSRILREFEKEGAISVKRQIVTITDEKKLRSWM